jgi:hypothetical protein
MPIGWAAAATAGAAVLGAGASLYGSSQAAGAAKDASKLQLDMYNRTRADLAPYAGMGNEAMGNALALANSGRTGGGPDFVNLAWGLMPGQMTQAQLEQTPGYQFDLSQGLKAVQSAAAARGLGVSGASLKGAGTYATGLANKTYLDQFNVGQKRFEDTLNLNTGQQTNLQNQFNRLSGIATIGENAAAQTGAQGTTAASSAGSYLNKSGEAEAAGTTGVNNALTGGANSYLAYQNYQKYLDRYGSQTSGYSDAASSGTPATFETGNYAFGR